MGRSCFPKCRLGRFMGWLQIVLGGLVIIVSLTSLFRFYFAGFFFKNEDICNQFYGVKEVYEGFDVNALSAHIVEVLNKVENLLDKLESAVQQLEKNKDLDRTNILRLECKRYLEDEVIRLLYSAHISLRQIRWPKIEGNGTIKDELLINNFVIEEIRKYITTKENRVGKVNIYGTERVYDNL